MANKVRINDKKKFILFILTIIILIILFGSMFFTTWIKRGSDPIRPGNTELISINIPRGTGTRSIGKILKSSDLISDDLVFTMKSKLKGYSGKYMAGDYLLSPGMAMDEIMDMLLAGNSETTRFTIPEGYDIRRIADTLESSGLIDKDAFYREIKEGKFDYWFVDGLKDGEDRLEGFLFPETYEIYLNADEHKIIDKMLAQFDYVFTDRHFKRMEELNKNIEEVLILASIIEREAVISSDRPVISGVFQNRLKIGMPLQSCATIQYILGEQKPVLSTADTKIESLYNTYIHTGLPPTPICSPGIESIDAALWPEKTDFLFFLAKGDGSHVFSKTYEEHLANKAKYIGN